MVNHLREANPLTISSFVLTGAIRDLIVSQPSLPCGAGLVLCYNIPMRRCAKLHPEIVDEIKQMSADGLNDSNIARYLGISPEMVRYHRDDEFKSRRLINSRKYRSVV